MLGLDAKAVRKGSASCDVSPLSDAGIMSTTRTPVGGGGGGGEDPPSGGFWGRWQAAATKATAASRVVARMATGYTGGGPRVRSYQGWSTPLIEDVKTLRRSYLLAS